MSENLRTYTEAEATKYTRIVRAIGEEGLQQIDNEYGPGFDDSSLAQADPRTLEAFVFPWNSTMFRKAFLFHNGRHGRLVGKGTASDMRELGLPEPYVSLAEAIAKVHDRVRTSGIVLNEQESARWFNEQLERHMIPTDVLRLFQSISNEANQATIPVLRGAQLIGQIATEQEYSGYIHKLIAYSVASNDLGELHQPTGPLLSHLWCYELHGGEPTREQLIEFETSQLAMDHEYQHPFTLWTARDRPTGVTTEFIQQRFTPYKSAVIEHCASILEGLQNGQLHSYADVVDRDIVFAIDCRQGRILPDYQR